MPNATMSLDTPRESWPRQAEPGLVHVSSREFQVLDLIASGLTHAQAARRLGISRHTVDTYVKRLRSKLGPGNKAHLVRMAAFVTRA